MNFDSSTPIDLITDGTTITYGVVQPGPEDADGVLFIRGGDISSGRINNSNLRTISKELSHQYKRTLLRGGELVISLVGNPGEVAVVPETLKGANIARQVGLIRIDEKRFNPKFVQYYLMSPAGKAQLFSYSLGSVQSVINLKELKRVEIPNAPLEIQDVIVKSLSDIDEKVDLNRGINQTLEAMAQAIFKSWFVDFDPVKAKIAAKQEGGDPLRAAMVTISGKPDAELDALPREQYDQLAATAALFPDEMEDSELGEIPRGWSTSKVEKLLTRLPAKTRYTKEQVSERGQIPVFEQGASILFGYHNGTASYQASAENPMFIFGDHTCITRLSCQPFDIAQNVIPLQGKDRPTAWTYYAIKEKQKFQEYRRHWMELISKDVVVATADPCLEFSKKVSDIHLQMEANERQMQGLRELRNTLLPKLLSGELSVTEAMTEVEA